MSQKVTITKVTHTGGPVFLGVDSRGQKIWSSGKGDIMLLIGYSDQYEC